MDNICIVGAGLAGLTLAETLRAEGYAGGLALIGDEMLPPYQRPPLSKAFLLGKASVVQLTIRSPELLARKNIRLLTDSRVVAIDRNQHRLQLADGGYLAYDGLALCTGARPRLLPWAATAPHDVHLLRTLPQAQALATALADTRRVVILGGGFIGLEVAAAARKQGKAVTVIEAAPHLLARQGTPPLSAFFHDLHSAHGVDFVFDTTITALVTSANRLCAVRCNDGREIAADLLLLGIGIEANDELAHAAGLECARGIIVDACSRTTDAAIVAAGDCTARRLDDGSWQRLESVQNAIEQAKSAAHALLGRQRPFIAAPWFWSDQYDIKLQTAGLSAGHDQFVLRGSMTLGCFSVFYYRQGVLVAIDSVNQPGEHMLARQFLDRGIQVPADRVADTGFPLHELLPNENST